MNWYTLCKFKFNIKRILTNLKYEIYKAKVNFLQILIKKESDRC